MSRGKKILYINQYFKHPGEPGSTRSYWISRELVDAGYAVTMIAQRNLAHGYVTDAPRFEEVDVDGIRVLYLRSRYSNSMGVVRRLWAFFSFMCRASWRAVFEKQVDLVIATSTPLTVALPALLRKCLRRTPYLFEVRDLWPEVPIQMGIIRNKFIADLLRVFERCVYRQAVHVVALSPGMRDGVMRSSPTTKTTVIPNMAKIDQFWPRVKNQELIKKMGMEDSSFKVLYFGQMGLSNAIPFILEAAGLVAKQTSDVEFIFVGHGMMKKRVEEAIREERVENIRIYDRVAMKEMSEIVNLCDVSLVTFSNLPILQTNSPNKLFDSLSAGKPVIVNSAGWTKEMVENFECGFFVDPECPSELCERIIQLKSNPELIQRLGDNARKLAEAQYDKSILCRRFKETVDLVFAEKIYAETAKDIQ